MDSSYRIVPARQPKTASVHDTAGTLGLHDTLQYGPRSFAAEIKTGDGLRSRVDNVRLSDQPHHTRTLTRPPL